MILFVFEGEATEPLLYSSIKHLFMPKEKNDIICSYKSNIYSLYNRMLANGYFDDAENDVSIVPLLQTHLRKQREFNHPLLKIKRWAEISEVFLFFDYDCQNKNSNGTLQLMNTTHKEDLFFECPYCKRKIQKIHKEKHIEKCKKQQGL